ncbi:MAG: DUF2076 domain-containing protein [Hyphomicrobiales bacterium]|nr:DUF2076 domain-containing protein [Hyphomicrobiales bacterium]
MTPAERQLVTELFDRLATLEDAPRDPEAERMILDGLAQAPNAVYALVQTALVQDEALRRANERIQSLEADLAGGREPGGFLDTMRDRLLGREPARREPLRSSVPSVRGGDNPMGAPAGFGGSQPAGAPGGYPGGAPMPQQPQSGGGSFLGTAAAAAAGVIGGSLLLDGIRSLGGGKGGGFGFADPAAAAGGGGSPWGREAGPGGGTDDLARQLGADQIGRGGSAPAEQRHGLFNDGDRPADADRFDQAASAGDAGGLDDGVYDDLAFDDDGFDGGFDDGSE